MAKPIPPSHQDLINKPIVAALAVTLPDGTPQVTPVWFSTDAAGNFHFNAAKGRLKVRALEHVKYAALMVLDPTNPYRYLAVRGPITEASVAEGRAHINALSLRYTGRAVYNGPADETRIRYTLTPEHVSVMGS